MSDDDLSHSGVESSTENDEGAETLVKGRARRSTAGRNMSTLLDAEADDELALLFAEEENDDEFDSEAEDSAGEDADDMRLDSSSEDEEDQGPNVQEEDLEGEKELQKHAKAERLEKKRKAHESLKLTAIRKRVKIDTSPTVSTPPARPKKKSERISWLPTPDEGPTRSSSRRQTMQNKELTHARLKDSEKKRIRLIATMEEAAKRKEKHKRKEMTQAERLAEAERVERINSKILNRWEEMEKKKAEEQRARLEALQNRRLEGPVMSWWSGIAKWVNGKLTRVGNVDIQQKPEKEEKEYKRKKKTDDKGNTGNEQLKRLETQSSEPSENGPAAPAPAPVPALALAPAPGSQVTEPVPDKAPEPPKEELRKEAASETKESSLTTPQRQAGFLDGIHLYASLPENSTTSTAPAPRSTSAPEPAGVSAPAAEPAKSTTPVPISVTTSSKPEESQKDRAENVPPTAEADPGNPEPKAQEASQPPKSPEASKPPGSAEAVLNATSETSHPTPAVPEAKSTPGPEDAVTATPKPQESVTGPLSKASAPPAAIAPPPASASASTPFLPNAVPTDTPAQPGQGLSVHTSPQTIVNGNHADPQQPSAPEIVEYSGRNLIVLENFDEKTAQSGEHSIYFNAKKTRLSKASSHLCVITSLPARYRDPDTGLPYANAYAYREIQRVAAQRYAWSSMLGCYVGPVGLAARGVPERFLDPTKKREKTQTAPPASNPNADDAPAAGKENEKATELKANGDTSASTVTAGAGDPMDVDK